MDHAISQVSWRSTLLSTMALFAIETEYITVTKAFNEVIWLLDYLMTWVPFKNMYSL